MSNAVQNTTSFTTKLTFGGAKRMLMRLIQKT